MSTSKGDPLGTYLHDHLAGSNFAIDLLRSLQKNYPEDQLGALAVGLLVEVETDRQTLQQIVARVGKGLPDLKEAVAWFAEKVSRLKLGHGDETGLGTFQALETLELGILGKAALWRALKVVAEADKRFHNIDFDSLIARAQEQYAQVERQRLRIASHAFVQHL